MHDILCSSVVYHVFKSGELFRFSWLNWTLNILHLEMDTENHICLIFSFIIRLVIVLIFLNTVVALTFFLRTFLVFSSNSLDICLIIVKLSEYQEPYPSISLIWFHLGRTYNKIYISSASILRFPFLNLISVCLTHHIFFELYYHQSLFLPAIFSVIMVCLNLKAIPILSNLNLWHFVFISPKKSLIFPPCWLRLNISFILFSHLLCSVFLMMHNVFHKAVYHPLLFLFLVHIVNILTWCFMPCWMRIATFNLTIAYLTFSQLLFCFSKYSADVKFVPFTLFFLALLKFCFV